MAVHGLWLLVVPLTGASGNFLGNGGLAWFDRGVAGLEGVPEAGWAFIPDAWGKGLATEAMAAVLAWGDTALKAPEIRCIIDPGIGLRAGWRTSWVFAFWRSPTSRWAASNCFHDNAVDKAVD